MAKKQLGQGADRFTPASQFGNLLSNINQPPKTEKPQTTSNETVASANKDTSLPDKPIEQSINQNYKRNSFGGSENMKLKSYIVDKSNAQKFKMLCTEQNTSASAVINDFIADYLQKNGK